MRLRRFLPALLMFLLPVLPAFAQIDRVVIEVDTIDCLPCAATIQYEVKKIDGVEKAAISIEKQLVAVTYKDGAHFDAAALREAIKKAEVRIDAFHLAIRGKMEQEDGKKIFVSNGDHFVITDGPEGMPLDASMGIMATVDDTTTPYGLTVDDFKLTSTDAAAPTAASPAAQEKPGDSAAPPASETQDKPAASPAEPQQVTSN